MGPVAALRAQTLAALRRAGLDAVGIVAGHDYDACVHPVWRRAAVAAAARSALVLGWSGRAFERWLRAAPEVRDGRPDPLDRFTRRHIEAALARLEGLGERRCFFDWEQRAGRHADLIALATRAGLGARGRHGLLLHRRFGSWWSLRGWVLVSADLGVSGPADAAASLAWSPCGGCEAPCASACPAGAIGPDRPDVRRCMEFQRRGPGCVRACHARQACPVGAEFAHSPALEARFRAAARRALLAPPASRRR